MKKGFLKTGCTKIRISNFQCPGTGVAENLVVYFLGYSLIRRVTILEKPHKIKQNRHSRVAFSACLWYHILRDITDMNQ
jgi:hypothetical protein